MQDTDERSARTFDDLDDLSFTTGTVCLLARNCHTHDVAVERTTCLGRLYEHVIFIAIRYHECKTFAGHLHLSCHLREHFFPTSAATTAVAAPSA